jgi:sulfur carrier protein
MIRGEVTIVRLVVNGTEKDYTGPPDLASLLDSLQIRRDRRGLAVAVNQQVVPREEYPKVTLKDGDRIEIIEAVQGG